VTRVIASSVRGPAHVRDGLPCQDAWLAVPGGNSSLAVVCDGMGSKRDARQGSRAATLATRDAWRAWRRSVVGTIEDLVRHLEVTWRFRLQATPPSDAATTCLLYVEDDHGRAAIAQLGDGLIARRYADGTVQEHPTRSEGFGLTDALGSPHGLSDWVITHVPPLRRGESILLATDGVSEDLERDRIGDLMRWVVEELGPLPNANRLLRSELQSWPVPHHQDDKTLLVMWKP